MTQLVLPFLTVCVITSYSIHYTKLYENIGGEFKGLIYLRDSFIPGLINDIDQLAYEIIV